MVDPRGDELEQLVADGVAAFLIDCGQTGQRSMNITATPVPVRPLRRQRR